MYRYYTGVFGNFRRVGEDGDLSVSGSVNQNSLINSHLVILDVISNNFLF